MTNAENDEIRVPRTKETSHNLFLALPYHAWYPRVQKNKRVQGEGRGVTQNVTINKERCRNLNTNRRKCLDLQQGTEMRVEPKVNTDTKTQHKTLSRRDNPDG